MADPRNGNRGKGGFSWFPRRCKDLPLPPTYVELDRESQLLFIRERQKFTGVNLNIVRPLTTLMSKASGGSSVFFLHNLTIGSERSMRAPLGNDGYQFQAQYLTKTAKLVGAWSPRLMLARVGQQFRFGRRRAALAEIFYERVKLPTMPNVPSPYRHFVNLRSNLKYDDYTIEGRFKSADLQKGVDQQCVVSYTQSVSPSLVLGAQIEHALRTGKTNLSFASRFARHRLDEFGLIASKRPTMVWFAELVLKQISMESPTKVFRTSFFKQIEHNTKMGTEFEWDIGNRSAKLMYGFEQNYISGAKVKITMTHDFNLSSQLDFKLTPRIVASVLSQARIMKSEFKFGLNLQFH